MASLLFGSAALERRIGGGDIGNPTRPPRPALRPNASNEGRWAASSPGEAALLLFYNGLNPTVELQCSVFKIRHFLKI
jgi:hypothetical protein